MKCGTLRRNSSSTGTLRTQSARGRPGWALFDWDEEGLENFVSDPRSRRSFKKPGTTVDPRRRSSPASTTPSVRLESDPSKPRGCEGRREFRSTLSPLVQPADLELAAPRSRRWLASSGSSPRPRLRGSHREESLEPLPPNDRGWVKVKSRTTGRDAEREAMTQKARAAGTRASRRSLALHTRNHVVLRN
jgi:hypothetical protein